MGYAFGTGLPTVGGTGTGLTVNVASNNDSFSAPVIYDGGPISGIVISNPGTNYFIGDVLTPIEAVHPQPITTPAQLTVSNIQGSVQSYYIR